MIIPTFQFVQFVDKDGYLTPQMQLYNDELNNILRNGLSDNGWTLPQVTQAQLNEIQAFTGTEAMPDGTMWVCTDVSPMQLIVKLDGTLHQVTTTPFP
jgi:hypothetical protein